MCGPLVLALPAAQVHPVMHVIGRVLYNLGRVTTYALLGVVFGLIGHTLALAGVQRWVSIGLGVVILIGLFFAKSSTFSVPVAGTVSWLKSGLGFLLKKKSVGSLYLLGGLNGLLPCGLVYAACAGAAATGTMLHGVEYMVVFGLGTVPMMLGLGLAGTALHSSLRARVTKLVPVSLLLLAGFLILRGLSLGIPYISPDLSGGGGATCCPRVHGE
jgi:sulfite exporter TauE/SafE